MSGLLRLEDVSAGYGEVQVLHDLSLETRQAEVHCLVGRNGAGKTTTLKTIMGLLPLVGGQITLDGQVISDLDAHEVPRLGIGYVPQGRRLFSELTVAENLEIGLMTRRTGAAAREKVLELFPKLKERLKQRSGTLSGGEQQMLAMARALCLEPKVLLLDEPMEGLMPSAVASIRETVTALCNEGVTSLLVEQRADTVLKVANRVSFIENGRIRETVEASVLRKDPSLISRYAGLG